MDIQGMDSYDFASMGDDFEAGDDFASMGDEMIISGYEIGNDPVAELLAAASGYGGGYSGSAQTLIGRARAGNPRAQQALVQRARQIQMQRAAASRNVRAAVAQSAARTPNAAVLRDQRPTHARRYPLGFVQLAVPAGATVTIIAQPQLTFRPERFVVPRLVAPNFLINQIVIGKNPQLVSVGQIPADAFTEDSVDTSLGLDTANVGQLISLQVVNATIAAADFRAVMIGPVVE